MGAYDFFSLLNSWATYIITYKLIDGFTKSYERLSAIWKVIEICGEP